MPEALLRLDALTCAYADGAPVLSDVGLEIRAGETLLIAGTPGSGKSTLLRHLNGLLRPASGRVLLRGKDIHRDKKTLRHARAEVGLVFQFPEHQLFAATVAEDIAFGPRWRGLGAEETAARVEEARIFADLAPEILSRPPQALSGGEKRRAALAGVMAAHPSVLALDEPLAGLDPLTGRELMARLREWRDGGERALIIVTHDLEEAARTSDRLLVLREGRVAALGPLPQVLLGEETGLPLPAMPLLGRALAARGIATGEDVLSADEMAERLLALWPAEGKVGGGRA
ncbi:MAG: ATP-binding cassette domain-containing protein [Gracilibacteraceae bacterium]|jgi:energy-coupling factor transport system ATP-binding protein|nr:ATP-binding cassette domain-containing protein [Gracilibacteraceae bacterium]